MVLTFPARLMLVAAMNPCPCRQRGNPEKVCLCPPLDVKKDIGRISGPLLDRIDLHVEVPAVWRSGLSRQGYDRVLKVARTIADLAEAEAIGPEQITKAIQYRNLERESWA